MANDYEIRYMRARQKLREIEPRSESATPAQAAELTRRGQSFVIYSPQFRRWFKRSKVVDSRGMPLVVWHGSKNPKFTEFRYEGYKEVGPHFGTYAAATEFLPPDLSAAEMRSRIRPFYLSIQNPLAMSHDPGQQWTEGIGTSIDYFLRHGLQEGILYELIKQKIISPEDAQRIIGQFEVEFPRTMQYTRARHRGPFLNSILRGLGFDGIVYKNQFEDKGSISWTILDPRQAKSVYNVGGFSPDDPDVLAGLR